MRAFCTLFLLVFTAAVAAFCYYNWEPTTVRFADWSITTSLASVVGVGYVLGMLSGWTLIGMVRRSANRVVEGFETNYART